MSLQLQTDPFAPVFARRQKPVHTNTVDETVYWLVKELHGRTFPAPDDIRQRPANTNILISGLTQQGKTTTAGKLILGKDVKARSLKGHPEHCPCGNVDLSKLFLDSLLNHPVFTNDPKTAWRCHLSVSPLPFFKALVHDLRILNSGSLERRELPPGSTWLLDEPTDVDSLDYWSEVAKAMSAFVTMYAFLGVDLIVLAPIKDQVLKRLKGLSHVWIDQKEPGHSDVWSMVPWTDIKGKKREQFMRPVHRCKIVDEKQMPQIWLERYPKIKTYNATVKGEEIIDRLEKKGYIN